MLISSAANSRIKLLRQLMRESQVDSENRIVIEGVKLVQEALRSGLRVEAVYVSQRKMEEGSIQEILKQAKRYRPEMVLVSEKVFNTIVSTETPQGIIALVKLPQFQLSDVLSNFPLVLIAHQLQDPGNLGTLVRSAEAFGVSGILLTRNTVSALNQKAIRASAGSFFRLPTLAGFEPQQLVGDLRQRGFKLIAATSQGDKDFRKLDYRGSTALLFGNEARGLPKPILSKMDITARIPLRSTVESLNVATASAIILCEAARQRAANGE